MHECDCEYCKATRPGNSAKPSRKAMTLRLTALHNHAIEMIAKERGDSKNEVIRSIIEDYIDMRLKQPAFQDRLCKFIKQMERLLPPAGDAPATPPATEAPAAGLREHGDATEWWREASRQ